MMKLRQDRERELLRSEPARQTRVVHGGPLILMPSLFVLLQRSPEAQRRHHEGPDSNTAGAVGQRGAEDRKGGGGAGGKTGPAVVGRGGEAGHDAEVHQGAPRTHGTDAASRHDGKHSSWEERERKVLLVLNSETREGAETASSKADGKGWTWSQERGRQDI